VLTIDLIAVANLLLKELYCYSRPTVDIRRISIA